jgi:hypothetical protein
MKSCLEQPRRRGETGARDSPREHVGLERGTRCPDLREAVPFHQLRSLYAAFSQLRGCHRAAGGTGSGELVQQASSSHRQEGFIVYIIGYFKVRHTEWQWPTSGVHSIKMEKSAQLVRVGGARPSPFILVTITYKVAVYAATERADTLPLFHLYPYMYSVVRHKKKISEEEGKSFTSSLNSLLWRKGNKDAFPPHHPLSQLIRGYSIQRRRKRILFLGVSFNGGNELLICENAKRQFKLKSAS